MDMKDTITLRNWLTEQINLYAETLEAPESAL